VSVLNDILQKVQLQIEEDKKNISFDKMKSLALDAAPPLNFIEGLSHEKLNIICEIKFASPSEGDIFFDHNPEKIAGKYLEAGAYALSILTERHYFKGNIDYIKRVKKKYEFAKILRKDFITTPYQVYQTLVYGASSFLLIATILEADKLEQLILLGESLGMHPVVEAHTPRDMEKSIKCGAKIIGVNNRDLKTMEVSLEISKELGKNMPAEIHLVSESGIRSYSDMKCLMNYGYQTFLVGTVLMKSEDPGKALKKLMNDED
jgi:indole-3-glycerol phosphate synthase